MSNVIIADVKSASRNGKSTGHYFTVAQNYCDALSDYCEVVIAGGPIYKDRFNSILPLKYNTSVTENAFVSKLKVLSNFKELVDKTQEDIVVLQSNAVATTFLALSLFARRRKVFMIQYNLMSLDSRLKRFLYRIAKNKIAGIICPSREIGEAYSSNYCVVPDYMFTKTEQSHLNDSSELRYDFSIVGIITEDKGVVEAAKYFSKTRFKVVIAGRPVNEQIKDQLVSICKDATNISLILGYVSDSDYDLYIRSSRYTVLNYTDAYSEHSSGVIYDALYRGVPVIGRRCSFLKVVEEKQMGYLYDTIEDCDFVSLLIEKRYKEYKDNLEGYLLSELNTGERLYNFLTGE